MTVERRRHDRKRCSIPCEVRGSGKPVAGTVHNVSAGGLSVLVDLDVDQGDVLTLILKPGRRPSIEIQAIVWHHRRVKLERTGGATRRLGLVLSEAPDAFTELLPATKPAAPKPNGKKPTATQKAAPRKPLSARPAAPKPGPRVEPPKPAGLPNPNRYRIRLKQRSSPRTRSILVFAGSDEEARERGLAETGPDWSILEVERA
jgi:hypothetical protein